MTSQPRTRSTTLNVDERNGVSFVYAVELTPRRALHPVPQPELVLACTARDARRKARAALVHRGERALLKVGKTRRIDARSLGRRELSTASDQLRVRDVGSEELPPRYCDGEEITTPRAASALFRKFVGRDREHVVVVGLSTANRVVFREVVAVGTLDCSLLHAREIFCRAIAARATSIVIGHNHPSGNVEPSAEDLAATDRLRKAGDILGIPLLDHVIVSRTGWRSLVVGEMGRWPRASAGDASVSKPPLVGHMN